MVISMAVILIPIAVLVWFFAEPGDEKPQAVDVAPVVEKASSESPFALLVPDVPGTDWVATRVAWAKQGQPWITSEPAVGNSWQVGYLSPAGVYFGVQQRDASQSELIESATRSGRPLGDEVELVDLTWQRYESPDGRTRSLVNSSEEVVSIVTADTDFIELEAFASTLVEVAPVG